VKSESSGGPQISLEQLSVARDGVLERWNVGWNVRNTGLNPLRILAVRLPHGQFKSDEQRFDPAIDLKPGHERQFQTLVRCSEPPGLVTENAFVIFHVTSLDERWRIFVRIRVIVNSDGRPQAGTELITMQKVGFSGVDS
jgi:hypothetical protein